MKQIHSLLFHNRHQNVLFSNCLIFSIYKFILLTFVKGGSEDKTVHILGLFDLNSDYPKFGLD